MSERKTKAEKMAMLPAFAKVPGYQQLQTIINPYSGFDFDKMRDDLMKLAEASDKEKYDATLEELKQKWYENEYRNLCLQDKLDMSLDQFVQLMHANVDKWMDKSMPPAAMSLMQSIMKDQNEKARLAIEFMRLQLAREMHEDNKAANAKRLSEGYIDIQGMGMEKDQEKDGV